MSRRAQASLAVLLATLAAGCDATIDVPECDRLEAFSCDCFPGCQTDDQPVIDARDPAKCDDQLQRKFEYWQACESACTANCEYGWGTCAFEKYRQLGLEPSSSCPRPSDAGTD